MYSRKTIKKEETQKKDFIFSQSTLLGPLSTGELHVPLSDEEDKESVST